MPVSPIFSVLPSDLAAEPNAESAFGSVADGLSPAIDSMHGTPVEPTFLGFSVTQSSAIIHHCALGLMAAQGRQDEQNIQATCDQLAAVSLLFDHEHCRVYAILPHCLFGAWLDQQLSGWQNTLESAVQTICGELWKLEFCQTLPTAQLQAVKANHDTKAVIRASDEVASCGASQVVSETISEVDSEVIELSGLAHPPTVPNTPTVAGTPAVPALAQASSTHEPYGLGYTLDDFFVNAKNQFPMRVLREAVSGNPAYTLLVLYGTAGSGKTHLARALGNALSLRPGNASVFCGSADNLELLLTPGSLHEAVRQLTAFQAIIIDDIDHLSLLPRLGDVLPMLMDHCRDHAKIFACTTRQHPSAWGSLPHLVRARLDQALIMSLHEADMDIRLRYAQAHSQHLRLNLSRSQLLTLARQCVSLRRLIGVLQRLAALRDLIGHDISAQDMERTLSHTADTGLITPQLIVRVTAVRCGVRPEEVLGSTRRPKVVRARQVAMYLCRELLASSYPALGRFFGGRDHSTVIHAVKKIQVLRDSDKDTHNLVTELSLTCRQTAK